MLNAFDLYLVSDGYCISFYFAEDGYEDGEEDGVEEAQEERDGCVEVEGNRGGKCCFNCPFINAL